MPSGPHHSLNGVMPKDIAYTPEEVTKALTVLAEHGTDFAAAADDLRDNHDFEVRARNLREWRESHVEQYRKLQQSVGSDMEDRAVQKQRRLINLADDKLEPLLERAGDAKGDDVPAALRAVADVKAKSANALMQLTGRPTSPKDNSSSDIVELLKHMADRGYLSLAPQIADSIDGTVEDDEPPDAAA